MLQVSAAKLRGQEPASMPPLFIIMSTYTEDAYRLMASDSGADAYVNKGVIFDALRPAIRDLIRRMSGGSGPLPPGIGGSSAWPGSSVLFLPPS
jgi:DNA-binding response OmpR family regulator